VDAAAFLCRIVLLSRNYGDVVAGHAQKQPNNGCAERTSGFMDSAPKTIDVYVS
jgi:hypothetical protein